MKIKGFLAILPTLCCLATYADAQSIDKYAEEYVRSAGINAVLFTGRMQTLLPGGIESLYLRERGFVELNDYGTRTFPKPISPTESFSKGDLFYDGVLYRGVAMRLDLYRGEISITPGDWSIFGSVIDNSRFGYADVLGYRLIYIPAPPSEFNLPEGYYQRLHYGAHDILRRENVSYSFSTNKFTDHSVRFWVKKDGVYHRIGRSRGALLRLLGEHRSELKRYAKANRLDMRNYTEKAIVEIVSEYERLTGR